MQGTRRSTMWLEARLGGGGGTCAAQRIKRGTVGRLGEGQGKGRHAELQVWVAQPNRMPNSGSGKTEVLTRQARAEIRRRKQRRAQGLGVWASAVPAHPASIPTGKQHFGFSLRTTSTDS